MISNSISEKSNTEKNFYKRAGLILFSAAFVLTVLSGGVYGRQEPLEGDSAAGALEDKSKLNGTIESNKHKSGFIEKINRFVKSGDPIPAARYARLKNEIEKLRERITKRIERIDKKTLDLNSERARIVNLLSELETASAAFNKIKIEPAADKTSETVLRSHKTGEVEVKTEAKKDKKSRRGRHTN